MSYPEIFVDVLAASDLLPGTQKSIRVGLLRILLIRTGESLYAVEDLCSHALQPLFGGTVNAGIIRCPKHGACFNLVSGKPTNGVTKKSIRTFRVRSRNDRIEVETGPPVIPIKSLYRTGEH